MDRMPDPDTLEERASDPGARESASVPSRGSWGRVGPAIVDALSFVAGAVALVLALKAGPGPPVPDLEAAARAVLNPQRPELVPFTGGIRPRAADRATRD